MNIVKAKLIKRKTDDGYVEVREGIPLGKEYLVDLDDISEYEYYNTIAKKSHTKIVILDVETNKYLPLELLEIISEEKELMMCPQCGKEKSYTGSDVLNPFNLCFLCLEETILNSYKIEVLIEKGHSEHCAKRQIYGDGECECQG